MPELDKLKSLRAEKVREITESYHNELVKLKVKYLEKGDLDTAVALTDEIAGKTPEPARMQGQASGPANAEIFVNCDDLFSLTINGKVVLTGGGQAVQKTRVALQTGDKILVRLGDAGQQRGFACVIRRQGKDSIATGDGSWQIFTPKDEADWSNPDQVASLQAAVPASNQVWAKLVASESLTSCQAIWGDSDIAFLFYEISD